MPEIDPQLIRERKKILRRRRRSNNNLVYVFLCFVSAIVLTSLSNNPLIKEINLGYYLVNAPAFILLMGWLYFLFKATSLRQGFEDSTFLKVFKIIEDLETYFEDKNDECRKKAESKLNNLMSDIESLKGGSLKVYQNELGPHVTSFKEAFYRKLVAALRQHEKTDLEKAFNILTDFAKFLSNENSRIADLDLITDKMNKEISVTLPPKTPMKLTFSNLKTYHYFNDIIACVISIFIGAIVGFIGKYGLNVANEYTYTMAVTIALGRVVLYFSYLRRGQK